MRLSRVCAVESWDSVGRIHETIFLLWCCVCIIHVTKRGNDESIGTISLLRLYICTFDIMERWNVETISSLWWCKCTNHMMKRWNWSDDFIAKMVYSCIMWCNDETISSPLATKVYLHDHTNDEMMNNLFHRYDGVRVRKVWWDDDSTHSDTHRHTLFIQCACYRNVCFEVRISIVVQHDQ